MLEPKIGSKVFSVCKVFVSVSGKLALELKLMSIVFNKVLKWQTYFDILKALEPELSRVNLLIKIDL